MSARSIVAYQGEPGAYGEEAILGYFGETSVETLPLPTFSTVCAAVVDGRAAAAVLPLENSLAGTVGEAIDALIRSDLEVVGELLLPVRHQLIALTGVSLSEVERVASHFQALAQCEAFLSAGAWEVIVADNTATAARRLAEGGDRHGAVVASARAAARHGLAVLARDIQDASDNQTRFAVAARRGDRHLPAAAGPLAATSTAGASSLVAFQTRDRPGALHHALGSFAEAGVNMSRIESRPSGQAHWEYRFIASVDGDATEEPLRTALEELRQRAHAVHLLGSFRSAG